jgi:hypothetical protein
MPVDVVEVVDWLAQIYCPAGAVVEAASGGY